jgi:Tfp pilus assembly protein PilF
MSRIAQLLVLLKTEPGDQFLNYALALEYANGNEKAKAIEIILKIIDRDENYLGAYYQLGQLYEQIQQFENAGDIYRKGIEIAKRQRKTKTLGELSTALDGLE